MTHFLAFIGGIFFAWAVSSSTNMTHFLAFIGGIFFAWAVVKLVTSTEWYANLPHGMGPARYR